MGLKTLSSNIEKIVVPDVSTEIDIPVIGKIKVEVTAVKCVDFQEPRELTDVEIDDESFRATAQQVSATFVFHWHWKVESLPISGSGGASSFYCGSNLVNRVRAVAKACYAQRRLAPLSPSLFPPDVVDPLFPVTVPFCT